MEVLTIMMYNNDKGGGVLNDMIVRDKFQQEEEVLGKA